MKSIIFTLLILIPVVGYTGLSNSIMTQAANAVNKMTPKMVDKETRLDKALGFNKSFIYIYTLVNYAANQLNPKKLKANLEPGLKKTVCGLKAMKVFFQNGITVNYTYFSNDNRFILNIAIKPSTCGF